MSVCLSEDQMCSTPHTCSICSICMYVAGDGYVPLSELRIPPWCSVQCKAPIADLVDAVALTQHWDWEPKALLVSRGWICHVSYVCVPR